MTDNNRIRKGSLQFYPRVRAKKSIPSENWSFTVRKNFGLLGFIGYKVGMVSVWVKDNTENSMTKGKRIAVPATVLECPSMKIYSVRFYLQGRVVGENVVSQEKILKRKVKVSKKIGDLKVPENYDSLRIIAYTEVAKTGIGKKTPDMIELGFSGTKEEALAFVKDKIGKEIGVKDVFDKGLVDVSAVTRGFGTQGPVQRMGLGLKDHKTEKGRRRPGSLGPWHPARVTFRVAQMGQTGYHTRTIYNNLILRIAKISEHNINPKEGFAHYGVVKNDYILIHGSVPGPKKRGVVLAYPGRASRDQLKKNYEVLEVR